MINPDRKSDYKIFSLKNMESNWFASMVELRGKITSQFEAHVSQDPDFAIGYLKGQTKLWIQNESDLKDVWDLLKKGSISTLWCDGHHTKQKPSENASDSEHSDSERPKRKKPRKGSAVEDKRERVEGIKAELCEKHGSSYTPLQYSLWAEMVDVGTHTSLEEAPSAPMFVGKTPKPKKAPNTEMGTVFTEMAKSIITALKPSPTSEPVPAQPLSCGISPGKTADIRSKYLQQMRELFSLYEAGALTEREFANQKGTVLGQLNKLTGMPSQD